MNDKDEIRRAALDRAETAALRRLGALRGDLIDVLAIVDRAMPRVPVLPRLDAGNLVGFPRRQNRRDKCK